MSTRNYNTSYGGTRDQERGYDLGADPSATTGASQRLSEVGDAVTRIQDKLNAFRGCLPSGHTVWTGTKWLVGLTALGATFYGFHVLNMDLKKQACRAEDKHRQKDLDAAWAGGRQQAENRILDIYKNPRTVTETETQLITVTPASSATPTAQPKLLARCWTEDGCEPGKEAETMLLALMDHEGLSAAGAVLRFGEMLKSLKAAVSSATITASPVPTTFATSSTTPSTGA